MYKVVITVAIIKLDRSKRSVRFEPDLMTTILSIIPRRSDKAKPVQYLVFKKERDRTLPKTYRGCFVQLVIPKIYLSTMEGKSLEAFSKNEEDKFTKCNPRFRYSCYGFKDATL